jgi:hypothetical protein
MTAAFSSASVVALESRNDRRGNTSAPSAGVRRSAIAQMPAQISSTPTHWSVSSRSPISGPASSATINGAVPRITGYVWLMSPAR